MAAQMINWYDLFGHLPPICVYKINIQRFESINQL